MKTKYMKIRNIKIHKVSKPDFDRFVEVFDRYPAPNCRKTRPRAITYKWENVTCRICLGPRRFILSCRPPAGSNE